MLLRSWYNPHPAHLVEIIWLPNELYEIHIELWSQSIIQLNWRNHIQTKNSRILRWPIFEFLKSVTTKAAQSEINTQNDLNLYSLYSDGNTWKDFNYLPPANIDLTIIIDLIINAKDSKIMECMKNYTKRLKIQTVTLHSDFSKPLTQMINDRLLSVRSSYWHRNRLLQSIIYKWCDYLLTGLCALTATYCPFVFCNLDKDYYFLNSRDICWLRKSCSTLKYNNTSISDAVTESALSLYGPSPQLSILKLPFSLLWRKLI